MQIHGHLQIIHKVGDWLNNETYQELIELIEGQRSIINKQLKIITKLVNENAEKENMINTIMKELGSE